jgi:hypothetical protein
MLHTQHSTVQALPSRVWTAKAPFLLPAPSSSTHVRHLSQVVKNPPCSGFEPGTSRTKVRRSNHYTIFRRHFWVFCESRDSYNIINNRYPNLTVFSAPMMSRNFLRHRWYNFLQHGTKSATCCCSNKFLHAHLESHVYFNAAVPLSTSVSMNQYMLPRKTNYFLLPRNRPQIQVVPVQFVSNASDSDSEDDSIDVMLDEREERELKDPSEVFRSSLYPDSLDPLILKLNESKSVQDVFIFLHKNQDNLNSSHVSQAVLVLWDLQRIFMQVCVDRNPQDNYSELQRYIKAVSGHPDFHNLLRLVKKFCIEFSPDALTCSLLYLTRMNIDRKNPTMSSLLYECEKGLMSFPLTAISRFLVAVHGGQLWTVAISQPVVPRVLQQLMECEDTEQFRLLTICLSNLHYFVTPSVLSMYKSRVKYLLDRGIIGSKYPRTVVKIINFLDFPRWSVTNSHMIIELMQTLSGQISELRSGDIVSVHRAIQSQLEPVNILEEIQVYVLKLLDTHDPSSLPVDMLACVVPFSSPSTREKVFEDLLASHIKSPSFPATMPILFKILRYLKTSNVNLCDLFWSTTLKFLRKSEKEDYKLLRVCHKYMHFNNNLGGTYRHLEFERQMLEWLCHDLNKVTGMIPTKLARIAAFILGYSQASVPTILLKKIEEMASQFSILDCLNISRGLQVATELRSRFRGPYVVDQLVTVSSILSACTRSHLASTKLTLSEINMLMRTYINMKGVSCYYVCTFYLDFMIKH